MHLRPLSPRRRAPAVDDRVVSVPMPATAGEAAPTAALVPEVHRAFTLNGNQIPPEIFRDFGDGDLADSGTIWVRGWGASWTRAFAVVNYEQAVKRAMLIGRLLERLWLVAEER
jgi:hypothetical protein